MPAGRPSEYTPEIAEEILDRLADGQSQAQISRELGIARKTIRYWRDTREEFSARYARAWQDGMEVRGDEILELADSADSSNFNERRLQIDTRKWVMSKIAPKQYGDKSKVEHTGEGGAALQVVINHAPKPRVDSGEG